MLASAYMNIICDQNAKTTSTNVNKCNYFGKKIVILVFRLTIINLYFVPLFLYCDLCFRWVARWLKGIFWFLRLGFQDQEYFVNMWLAHELNLAVPTICKRTHDTEYANVYCSLNEFNVKYNSVKQYSVLYSLNVMVVLASATMIVLEVCSRFFRTYF